MSDTAVYLIVSLRINQRIYGQTKEKTYSSSKGCEERTAKKVYYSLHEWETVRGKRPETIDGIDADEFIRRNADPIWLHQNEMWEYMNQTDKEVEFNWPWTMIPLELAEEWIEEVKKGLDVNDPIYGKDIFVSGRNESENVLLVDNDSDGTYAMVRYAKAIGSVGLKCSTIEIFKTSAELALKLKQDHIDAVKNSGNQG